MDLWDRERDCNILYEVPCTLLVPSLTLGLCLAKSPPAFSQIYLFFGKCSDDASRLSGKLALVSANLSKVWEIKT